jgi:ankyrin repeat protein
LAFATCNFVPLQLGDINFTEFCEGYSAMLRGTVPELLDFAWRVYKVSGGTADLIPLSDVYTVYRLALAGLEEVRKMQGSGAGGASEDTRFPDRAARQTLESIWGDRQAPLTRDEFKSMVMRFRKMVDCLIPGFELIPQDPLHRAAESGELKECQHLLKVDKLDVDGRDAMVFPTTPLHLACKYGHGEVMEELLAAGANARLLSAEGDSCLNIAVQYNRHAAVELLLNAKLDVTLKNSKGRTCFHTAAEYGNYKPLRSLLPCLEKRLMSLKDKDGWTPLHTAAMTDNWTVLGIVIEFDQLAPHEVDARDHTGRTPLHIAAEHRSLRVARKLVELGASCHTTDMQGRSILNTAVRVFDNEAMLALVLSDAQTDVNLTDNDGVTPLMACVEVEDIKMLRTLLASKADTNIQEHGTGRTALHRAVLRNWLDGVDALLGPQANCKILRDSDRCTPLDYARTGEIFELTRDYVERLYPKYHPVDHPVNFIFALVFDEGRWELQTEGEHAGERVLKRRKVSKAVAAKRVEHNMIDKESIKRQLRKSCLVVYEETVRIQEYVLGVVPGDIHEYAFVRVGAPLYRLQQEATKMRLSMRRTDIDRFEDYFIDENAYPNIGFQKFSMGEGQKLILNIIQAVPSNEAQLVIDSVTKGREPHTAGITLSYYKKYHVISDAFVLHEPHAREKVYATWDFKNLMSRKYWQQQLLEYYSSSKFNAYASLTVIREYFGVKFSFYVGFLSHYTNYLISPAIAGIIAFGIEFLPSAYESMTENNAEDNQKFNDQYDHPMLFAYGFFISVWCAMVVQGWATKENELAFKWNVDSFEMTPTPNPLSTAPVRLQFVDGTWKYRSIMTKAQRRQQQRYMALVTVPVTLFFIGLVAANIFFMNWLNGLVDNDVSLHNNFDVPGFKTRNMQGTLAQYAVTGLNALIIVLLNTVYGDIAADMLAKENHESIQSMETSLSVRLLVFNFVNTFTPLYYYAYYERELDKAAAMLASIMIVGQLVGNVTEYLMPYLEGRKPEAKRIAEREAKLQKKAKKAYEKKHGRVAINRAKHLAVVPGGGAAAEGDTASLLSGIDLEKGAGGGGDGGPSVVETFSPARDEIQSDQPTAAVEFVEVMIQFGLIAMFGAVWPLAALLAFINNFFEIRLDIWKFCNFVRRPLGEKAPNIGIFWTVVFELFAVMGITNHCFLCCVASDTMEEYFFPDISNLQRGFAAFAAENVLLLTYFCIRVGYGNRDVDWIKAKKREPLRFIRDAYRAGHALRERRYRMLLQNPAVSFTRVCQAEDIDEGAADRYLKIVRYIDSVPQEKAGELMYNSTSTIQSLVNTVSMLSRAGSWKDAGERPTAAGLLRELVPVTNCRQCYITGKKVREAAYQIWSTKRNVTVMGSRAATIMSIRQFACIQNNCTMPQAERYCRLVRYIDRMSGGDPWFKLDELDEENPLGLMQVLAAVAEKEAEGGDDGEPIPSELGPLVEPIMDAKLAYEKASVVRRRMYEKWVHDKNMLTNDMVLAVGEETGAFPAQLHRYLIIKRYIDDQDERKKGELLAAAAAGRKRTLDLAIEVQELVREGGWRDPGEPSFHDYTPPVVMDDIAARAAAAADAAPELED